MVRPLSGRGRWRRRVLPLCEILGWRCGFANERGGAPGRLEDHSQLRLERWIFPVLEQQPVGIALNNGENVVELMHDRPWHRMGGVEFAGSFLKPARSALFERRHFFVDELG